MLFNPVMWRLISVLLLFYGPITLASVDVMSSAQQLAHQQQALIQTTWQRIRNNGPIRSQKQTPALYYFVSFSMPDALLRGYLQDATRNGGVLVLRGVTPGLTLAQFIRQKLLPLLRERDALAEGERGKSGHKKMEKADNLPKKAKIMIDPNRFEQYDIVHVPTILVTRARSAMSPPQGCQLAKNREHCKPAAPETYWKLSGDVTSRWALEQLQKAGAPVAGFFR